MPIIKKCEITGCIHLATTIPVLSVALSIKASGSWIAPMIMPFGAVCGDHKSRSADDYITVNDGMRITHNCQQCGWVIHWDLIRIRFMPLGWKPEQNKRMKLDQVLEFKGVNTKWLGQKK